MPSDAGAASSSSAPAPRVVVVAARGRNGVIGADGAIPWQLPEDFAHFRAETMGHTLVMGRATYDSIGRPLPGRTTVVVTRDPDWDAGEGDRVLVAHGVPEALALAATLAGDVIVAGGAQIYALALPFATHLVLTELDLDPPGDTYFPPFDPADWVETRRVPGSGLTWVWLARRTPSR